MPSRRCYLLPPAVRTRRAAPGGGRAPRPEGAWEPGYDPGLARGVYQTVGPTECRADKGSAGPAPARANQGKQRHPGYLFLLQGLRGERHLSRDPRSLNLKFSPLWGIRRRSLRPRSLSPSQRADGAAGWPRPASAWPEAGAERPGGDRQRRGTKSEGKTKRRGARRRRRGPGGGSGSGGANGRARGGGRRGRYRDKAVAAAAARGPLAAAAARARAFLAPEVSPGDRTPPRGPSRGPVRTAGGQRGGACIRLSTQGAQVGAAGSRDAARGVPSRAPPPVVLTLQGGLPLGGGTEPP